MKSTGYNNLEEFLADRKSGDNIEAEVEETCLHGMRTGYTTQEIYNALTELVDAQKHLSILYIGEYLSIESIQSRIEDVRAYPAA